jgi:hypothetical protein
MISIHFPYLITGREFSKPISIQLPSVRRRIGGSGSGEGDIRYFLQNYSDS